MATCIDRSLLYVPGTKSCGLDEQFELDLIRNVSNYGLWKLIPIYADYVPVRDIIIHEKKRWKDKFGNDSLHSFPEYLVTNHYGAYCPFSRHFFPIYFEVASSFGSNRVLFVLLESKSPWYFSTRQSVTGIPDIRLYKMKRTKDGYSYKGKYITSGQRSYDSFRYWLSRSTQFGDSMRKYPLLISKPLLHKDVKKNRNYYLDNYMTMTSSSFYENGNESNYHFQSSSDEKFNVDSMVQATSIIDDELIAYISAALSILLVIVTFVQWMQRCYKWTRQWWMRQVIE